MLTNKKYSGRMPLVVVAALLSLMIMLPLAGCKNDTVPPEVEKQEQTGDSSDSSGGVGTDQGPTQYTVTFNANGGSAVASQTVESGQTATKPADPTLEGSWFLGWYSDEDLTKELDFTTPVTADTTVYAKWSYKLHTGPTKLTGYTSPNNTGSEWTYVAFGDWPQTIKAADVTVDETRSKTMGMLTYCLGSDGNHYVKQEENAYGSGTEYRYSNGGQAGQGGGDTQWFKVEPIVWRVLTEGYKDPDGNSTNKALLLAEKILTGGIPYYDGVDRTVGDTTIYRNNYEHSAVRAYLNGLEYQYKKDAAAAQTTEKKYLDVGFLQTAFTESARNLIADTTVDNTAESTTDAGNNLDQAANYACGNTTDKVFLLSEKEASTSEYGFDEYNVHGTGSTRIRVTTDYAKATGAYQDSTEGYGGWWWLRTPHINSAGYARDVTSSGGAYYYGDSYVSNPIEGVVPALSISLK